MKYATDDDVEAFGEEAKSALVEDRVREINLHRLEAHVAEVDLNKGANTPNTHENRGSRK